MGTLAVAVAAAIFAWFQVRQLKGTRDDQTRPYVAVYLETKGPLFDLVVKNFGATTARDVRLSIDQPILRSFTRDGEHLKLKIFDVLPTLVPGQEWRTFYDSGIALADLPELRIKYVVTATYKDGRGRKLPVDTFTLDWGMFLETEYMNEKTMDDVGRSLDKISTTLHSWTESLSGLAVYTRDGDAKDAAHHADLIRRGKIPPDPAPVENEAPK